MVRLDDSAARSPPSRPGGRPHERRDDLSPDDLSRTISAATAAALRAQGFDPESVHRVIVGALAEDLGTVGDITSAATIAADAAMRARCVSRGGRCRGRTAGAGRRGRDRPSAGGSLAALVADGDALAPGQALAEVTGPARAILAAERTSLNLLGHLCGVATVTAQWVDAVAGTATRIRDTRKTTPLLRELDKYAVRCGGGVNHRRGLDDAVLIKDNHVAAAGGVGAALDAVARAQLPGLGRSCRSRSTTSISSTRRSSTARRRSCSTTSTSSACREAVARIRSRAPHVLVEASGGITLDRAAAYAATGVDFLAVGALTHSAPALDIGLDQPD